KKKEREKRENTWEESTDVRRRVCARAGAGGSLLVDPCWICLRRVSNGGNISFSGFVTRVCSLVGGREKRTYQDGDVLRCCYSGVCSNGGGDDLAPAIDLAGKDYTRVKDGGGEECHGIWFVTVRHVPVVAGETRPFSDVSAPGGGDGEPRVGEFGFEGNGHGPKQLEKKKLRTTALVVYTPPPLLSLSFTH
ncbi:LOW QUALITY PROTEIN: hypothetical protein HID58_041373, partial [Brassica napus]